MNYQQISILGLVLFLLACSETGEVMPKRMPLSFHLPSPMVSFEDEIVFLNDTALRPFKKIKCEWGGLECAEISQTTQLRSIDKEDGCDIIYEYISDHIEDELEYFHNGEYGCLLNVRYNYTWDLQNRLIKQTFVEGRGHSMVPQLLEFTYNDEGLLESTYIDWMWAQDESQFFEYDEDGNLVYLEKRYAQCDTGYSGDMCSLHISKFYYKNGELEKVEIQADGVTGGEIREKIREKELVYKSDG